MIILLGGTGYIGEAFQQELRSRGIEYRNLRRSEVDYTKFDVLRQCIQAVKPSFIVNCAGYTGKPNVDACELAKADTLSGNVLLVQTIAHACEAEKISWGHVSSGCIYAGAKVADSNGMLKVESDLTRSDIQALYKKDSGRFHGFTEIDAPNFSFRDGQCSFYSGSKALGEEAIQSVGNSYIWRLRIPFDEIDGARNYLSKVQRYSKVYDNLNSISHRRDFVRACLDLWELQAPLGIYNVTNPGWVSTRQVVSQIESVLKPNKRFEFWENDEEFYRTAAKAPRSNCLLDSSKLASVGVRIRPVEEALDDALTTWRWE